MTTPSPSLREQFIALFMKVMNLETFDDRYSMDNLVQWDSLKQVQLISSMEEEFGLEIEFEDIMVMTSIEKIFAILDKVSAK